jgi:hypothetical protein
VVAASACAKGSGDDVQAPALDAAPVDTAIAATDAEPEPEDGDIDEPLTDTGVAPSDGEAPIFPTDPTDDPVDPPPPPLTIEPGCTAKATLGGVPAWIHFTRPHKPCSGTAGSGRDRHILNELTRLINSVPAGGRIDAHIFSISVDSVAKALLDAQTRGVAVWLSTDKQVASSTDTAKTLYLDKLTNKVYCSASNNTACIGTADDAISHTKLFVFSEATAPDGTKGTNVVWMGSANQTYASGMDLSNNTVTLYGDATLYTKLRTYLDDLYKQRRNGNYYDSASGRGYMMATAADVYASPDLETDIIVSRLNDLTPDSTCEMRVMQASLRDSRMAVVDLLVKFKKAGCKVYVLADTVESKALAALKAAAIPVRHHDIHDKAFIATGKYGTAKAFRIYTGSHNLSISANTKYDEIFVKLAPESGTAHPVYDAYYAHFGDVWAVATAL